MRTPLPSAESQHMRMPRNIPRLPALILSPRLHDALASLLRCRCFQAGSLVSRFSESQCGSSAGLPVPPQLLLLTPSTRVARPSYTSEQSPTDESVESPSPLAWKSSHVPSGPVFGEQVKLQLEAWTVVLAGGVERPTRRTGAINHSGPNLYPLPAICDG
jgi:hypothetical protein